MQPQPSRPRWFRTACEWIWKCIQGIGALDAFAKAIIPIGGALVGLWSFLEDVPPSVVAVLVFVTMIAILVLCIIAKRFWGMLQTASAESRPEFRTNPSGDFQVALAMTRRLCVTYEPELKASSDNFASEQCVIISNDMPTIPLRNVRAVWARAESEERKNADVAAKLQRSRLVQHDGQHHTAHILWTVGLNRIMVPLVGTRRSDGTACWILASPSDVKLPDANYCCESGLIRPGAYRLTLRVTADNAADQDLHFRLRVSAGQKVTLAHLPIDVVFPPAPSAEHHNASIQSTDQAEETDVERLKLAMEAQEHEFRRILDSRDPKLFSCIENITLGDCTWDGQPGTGIVLIASVSNAGESSIADQYLLHVTLVGQPAREVPLEHIPGMQLYEGSGPSDGDNSEVPRRILQSDEYLETKTMTPIPRGGKVRGYVVGVMLGVSKEDVAMAGTKFDLTCRGIDGALCMTTHTWDKSHGPGFDTFYPGLTSS